MGIDWNGDGKHDWKDDAFFHNVINSDSSKDESAQGGSRKNGNIKPQNQSVSKWEPSQLGCAVAVIAVFLIIAALFMGYGSIIPDLLGFAFIAFLIANWLDS